MHSKQNKLLQVLIRQIQETDNDVNTLKMTICAKARSNKICAKAGSNKMEVTKRLVDTAARYIMECYQEVERQLEDTMDAGQIHRLDPQSTLPSSRTLKE